MYDAIVVGARVAGAPAAMLLAREGYRVLLLDRDSFPSDIMSTHYIHVAGQVRLTRWGLLDKIIATGAPFITKRTLHLDGMAIQPPDPPLPPGLTPDTLCPRRYALDSILVDAAAEAGAEVRQGSPVRELLWEGDRVTGVVTGPRGQEVEERARIVIGADGLHSTVARGVKPEEYETVPTLTYGYYTYWTGIEDTGMHIHFFEDGEGVLVFPTNDTKTCVGVGGEIGKFKEFREDIEGNYMRVVERIPELGAQIKNGAERERYIGTADQPNYFRKPYGPGWALIGDAGYHRDFLTGLGINDAFLQAELLSNALLETWSGKATEEDALARFQATRDDYLKPTYDITVKMASGFLPSPAEFMQFGMAMMKQIPA